MAGFTNTRILKGNGFLLTLDGEINTPTAEVVAQNALKRSQPVELGPSGRDGTPLASLATSGWGQTYFEGIRDENPSDVLQWHVIPLGLDTKGRRYYLVPNTQTYNSGRAHVESNYRIVHVEEDVEGQAQEAQDALQRQLEQKQRELDLAKQAAKQGDLDTQLAIAKGEAGQGYHSIELSFDKANNAFVVAVSDYESANNHGGKSAIKAGQWERLAGTKAPSDFGLPKPIIDASNPDSPIIASELYRETVAAASDASPGYPGHYSAGINAAAKAVLDYIGVKP